MDVTRDDLAESRELILGEMRRGFQGVHDRQDRTNGRVQTLEIEQGRQDERIKNIGKEVFGRRAGDRRQEPPPAAADASSESRPITRRDVWISVVSIGGAVAFVKFLAWVGPALQAVKP